MKKNAKNSINYDAKFKIMVILDVVKNDLPVRVAVRKYWNVTTREEIDRYRQNVRYWRRVYESKGLEGFMKKESKQPPSLPKLREKSKKEYDLAAILAENEYLRMENMYLKKLRALILQEEQEKRRRSKSSRN
jgi:hypothetical protein